MYSRRNAREILNDHFLSVTQLELHVINMVLHKYDVVYVYDEYDVLESGSKEDWLVPSSNGNPQVKRQRFCHILDLTNMLLDDLFSTLFFPFKIGLFSTLNVVLPSIQIALT